jgi:hypothetical protein
VPENFTFSFLYKGIPREISCRLRASAFTYQFLCTTGETELILEKDDEGNMRALEADPFSKKSQKTDSGLVKALIQEMERILHE